METDRGGAERLGELAAEARYKKSRLTGIDVDERLSRLDRLMAQERLYASSELMVADVASRLRMNGPQLSELLNQHRGINFASYVNAFRIEAAKDMLLRYPDRSILDIGYECGFASKSAFNASFRKQTGSTPNGFRSRGSES